MSMTFYFNFTVTSEPLHIYKQYPAFLIPNTQIMYLVVPCLRVLLCSHNISVAYCDGWCLVWQFTFTLQ